MAIWARHRLCCACRSRDLGGALAATLRNMCHQTIDVRKMITPSTLVSHIEWLSQARILCVGDLMLDRFVYGEVERTSPEAPVPILGIERQSVMLGGVGNVARNLISIGAHAALLSVVGDDEVGRLLTQMVGEQERIEPHLLVEPGRPSTEKTRFVAGGQQLLRTDRETRRWIGEQSAENLLRMAEDIIPDCDVLVLSDYAKGVLTDDLCQALITCADAASKPVVVDPKGEDYRCYRGASIITPNRRELGAATGAPVGTDSEIVAAGRGLIEQLNIDALLVTRSQDGMTLISTDGRVEHLPAQAREVFDVSGAGDTVVATLTLVQLPSLFQKTFGRWDPSKPVPLPCLHGNGPLPHTKAANRHTLEPSDRHQAPPRLPRHWAGEVVRSVEKSLTTSPGPGRPLDRRRSEAELR